MIKLPLGDMRWSFRDTKTKQWLPATVPGCVHTDLIAAGKIEDPFFGTRELDLQWVGERAWEYRCDFDLGAGVLAEEVVDLVAEGLDTVATVYLNEKQVAATENMFVGYRWSVKHLLKRGRNRLRIHFASAVGYVENRRNEFTPPREYCDPVGNAVRIRKQPCQFGWDWGPRLVTAGVWRDLRLEAWTTNRIDHLNVRQQHSARGVRIKLNVQLAQADVGVSLWATCSLNGEVVARVDTRSTSLELSIDHAQLWWPAGQGGQPLYVIKVGGSASGVALEETTRRIGLRTIRLDRRKDEWGESFRFVVNGRPIFAKGANWVPAHSFVTTLTRERYARDLTAAAAAHMNMIRVWGGGIYESEDFYDLCDELGLLVWQDFMFSCALYPSDDAFVSSVEAEARHQVRRLQHRACLALWCGNNELAQLNAAYLNERPELKAGYVKVFHELLPVIVAEEDGVTDYWPSSEWRGEFKSGHALGEKSGDSHYWDVWHARHPVKDYEKWAFRFCSEFGMQSYSSGQTNATFCPPDDRNIFGPSMENHQKNRSGNQVILDYVCLRYRFPRSQDHLIYLSQLNQAYCMQVGVEHYRRLMPRCMGALYWQLNDCWPVASWSSIEFTGRWKALHYLARRFNAPAMVSAHVPGDEYTTIGNYRHSGVDQAHLYTVYDAPDPAEGVLRWEVRQFSGPVLKAGRKRVSLSPGESVKQLTLSLAPYLEKHGRDHVFLRIGLEAEGHEPSEQSVFLAPPRFASLPSGRADVRIEAVTTQEVMLIVLSSVFLHAVCLEYPGFTHTFSDNYFDLYPHEPRKILLRCQKSVTVKQVRARLRVHSLVDTYD